MSNTSLFEEFVLSENRAELLTNNKDKYDDYFELLQIENEITSILQKMTMDENTKNAIKKLLSKSDQIISSLTNTNKNINKLRQRHELRKYLILKHFNDDDSKIDTQIITKLINKLQIKFDHKKP
eukprot:520489_1